MLFPEIKLKIRLWWHSGGSSPLTGTSWGLRRYRRDPRNRRSPHHCGLFRA